jgi:CofD-related protein of GAK system
MTKIIVERVATIPDILRLQRYQRAPELGPSLLFFTGGSALKDFSRELKKYTHNSIHLMTPFDSGGSSASLREHFNMPAIGDIRSRLMALADESVTGNPALYELAGFRFPKDVNNVSLRLLLTSMVEGDHPLLVKIPNPMRRLIRLQLKFFVEQMTDDFDLRGASIGNLILTGGYLNYDRHLDPILFLFSKLLAIKGRVQTITNSPYHLYVTLESGEKILGQHLITGKEVDPIHSKVIDIKLSASNKIYKPIDVKLRGKVSRLIDSADLICYPPGSFYTSLIANLLPKGVGKSIAANDCPKVYIPNLGIDPEQYGMSQMDSVMTLIDYLQNNMGKKIALDKLLNFVIIDSKNGNYSSQISENQLKKYGITLIDTSLVSENSNSFYDSEKLSHALLSLT